MNGFKVVCYRASFKKFKTSADDLIYKLPASKNDDFALVASIDSQMLVGFDEGVEQENFIKSLVSKCYSIDAKREMVLPSLKSLEYMPEFMFRDKSGEFDVAVAEFEKYKIDLARYKFLLRHKPVKEPEPSLLFNFVYDESGSMSNEFYSFLKNNCHYIVITQVSGEHGYAAFNVFSDNLDFFFEELSSIIGEKNQLIFVDDSLKLPFT